MLAKAVSENQKDWDAQLPSVMAAYRASPHDATGFSPNFLMFGRENRAPLDLMYGGPPEDTQVRNNLGNLAADKVETMRKAYHLVRKNLGQSGLRMKQYYDMRVKPQIFREGTWVWFYSPRRYLKKSPKWQRMYSGPYLITRTLDPVNVVLQRSRGSKPFVTHIDKIKLCLGATPVSWLTINKNPAAQGIIKVDLDDQ